MIDSVDDICMIISIFHLRNSHIFLKEKAFNSNLKIFIQLFFILLMNKEGDERTAMTYERLLSFRSMKNL